MTGIALHNKTLVAALVAAVLLELLAVGPRTVLRSAWLWAAPAWRYWCGCRTCSGRPTTVAAAPLARAIAGGSSGSSQPWWLFLPMQLVLVSPVLVAMWLPGLVRLWRAAELGRSAPSPSPTCCWPWCSCSPAASRTTWPGCTRCCWPPGAGGRRMAAEPGRRPRLGGRRPGSVAARQCRVDAAGTAGTPLAVRRSSTSTTTPGRPWAGPRSRPRWPGCMPPCRPAERARAVVVTQNYGQAEAIDRYGPGMGLPRAYSGHNAYFDWGPPPDTGGPVVVIGFQNHSCARCSGRSAEAPPSTTASGWRTRSKVRRSGWSGTRVALGRDLAGLPSPWLSAPPPGLSRSRGCGPGGRRRRRPSPGPERPRRRVRCPAARRLALDCTPAYSRARPCGVRSRLVLVPSRPHSARPPRPRSGTWRRSRPGSRQPAEGSSAVRPRR